MRQIDPRSGYRTVQSHLRVLSKRLKSRPDAASIAAPVDAARRALDARIDAWEDAEDDCVVATGAVHYADEQEDEAVADIARRAKVITKGVLTAPEYVRLFSRAPSELTRGIADPTQIALVEHLLATIADGAVYRPLRDAARVLADAHRALLHALAGRSRCQEAAATAWTELQIAEQAARDVYRDTRPRLELLFPGRKRVVESFFPRKPGKSTREGSPPGSSGPTGSTAPDGPGAQETRSHGPSGHGHAVRGAADREPAEPSSPPARVGPKDGGSRTAGGWRLPSRRRPAPRRPPHRKLCLYGRRARRPAPPDAELVQPAGTEARPTGRQARPT